MAGEYVEEDVNTLSFGKGACGVRRGAGRQDGVWSRERPHAMPTQSLFPYPTTTTTHAPIPTRPLTGFDGATFLSNTYVSVLLDTIAAQKYGAPGTRAPE